MSALDRAVTVLFVSVGNEALHGFVDDLRARAPRWRLVGVDVRADAAGLYRCDAHALVPLRRDGAFWGSLRALVEREHVDVVYPLATEDQDLFSAPGVRERLGVPVVVASAEAVAIANHKVALFRHLGVRRHLLPDHEPAAGPGEALAALHRLVATHGAALVKADGGTGGAGMLLVGTPCADPAPVAGRAWLPLAEVEAALADGGPLARRLVPALFETGGWPRQVVAWLPGDEYSVDVLADAGATRAAVVRLRTRAVGGLAITSRVVDAPDVEAAAREVVAAVGLSYVANVQFRRDANGVPRLLEINPRIPGTIGLTVAAGVNLPLAAIAQALGERLALPAPRLGLLGLRYQGLVLVEETAP